MVAVYGVIRTRKKWDRREEREAEMGERHAKEGKGRTVRRGEEGEGKRGKISPPPIVEICTGMAHSLRCPAASTPFV